MRNRILTIGFLLAVILHVDWHLARPQHHHGLLHVGLDWGYHWVATAIAFGLVALFIARRWPESSVVIAGAAFAVGVLIAQVLEPIGESIIFRGYLGYADEPGRWAAFGQGLTASTLTYALALWLGGRRRRTELG